MYIPSIYKNEDIDSVRTFIGENGFALLINQVDGRPWATHLPLVLSTNSDGKDILFGHMAKANEQWRHFDAKEEVLAVFTGAHSYISPSWYDHANVPTWNYLSVHIYGRVRLLDDETVKQQLGQLIDKYEAPMKHPIRMESIPKTMLEEDFQGLIGFEIEITQIEAAKKLSQNRDAKNIDRIVEGLEAMDDAQSVQVAKAMKENNQL